MVGKGRLPFIMDDEQKNKISESVKRSRKWRYQL